MSNSHSHKETPKEVKLELEILREAHETVEETKAELLKHNQLIKLHTSEDKPLEKPEPKAKQADELKFEETISPKASEPAAEAAPVLRASAPKNTYIKQQADLDRIAKNTTIAGQEEKPAPATNGVDMINSQIQQLLTLQFRAVNTFMESWSNTMNAIVSQAARPVKTDQ